MAATDRFKLASLGGCPKVRDRSLEDFEVLLTILDRVLVKTKDRGLDKGKMTNESLNLTVKEKLPESGKQENRNMALRKGKGSTLKGLLVQWVEMRAALR